MKKILYFLSILILFLFNFNDVKALQVNFSNLEVQGYNNNGNSLTAPNTFNCSLGTCGMEITTYSNSYGGAFVIQSPIPIINNHNYSFSIRIRTSNYDVTTSSKPYISLGNSIANAKLNYEVSNFHTDLLAGHYAGNSTLQYVFKANATATHFTIPFTTSVTTTASFMIDEITIEDLGATTLTQSDITNIMNSQTSIIQNSLSETEQNINNNFNDTMQSIFGGCEADNIFDKNNYNIINGYIDENTLIWHSNPDGKFVTLPVKPNTTYTVMRSSLAAVQFGSGSGPTIPSNNTKVSQYIDGTGKLQVSITTKSNDNYLFIYVFWNGVTEGNLQQILNDLIVVEGSSDNCKNKLDSLNDAQKETNNKLDDLNDNITDSDSSEASGEAGDFFSNFNTDTFGLTSVITAPLELIKSVTSKTCTPLQGTLPFVNTDVNLPCLSTIYESHFGTFLTIYRTITFGFVSYWVCIKIFNLVKDFKNPEHDEIEVLDL